MREKHQSGITIAAWLVGIALSLAMPVMFEQLAFGICPSPKIAHVPCSEALFSLVHYAAVCLGAATGASATVIFPVLVANHDSRCTVAVNGYLCGAMIAVLFMAIPSTPVRAACITALVAGLACVIVVFRDLGKGLESIFQKVPP